MKFPLERPAGAGIPAAAPWPHPSGNICGWTQKRAFRSRGNQRRNFINRRLGTVAYEDHSREQCETPTRLGFADLDLPGSASSHRLDKAQSQHKGGKPTIRPTENERFISELRGMQVSHLGKPCAVRQDIHRYPVCGLMPKKCPWNATARLLIVTVHNE